MRVGDSLFTGTEKALRRLTECVASMARSPVQFWVISEAITFCGVGIPLRPGESIEISQSSLYQILTGIRISHLVKNDKPVLPPAKSSRVLKSFVGRRIWLFQTRRAVLFDRRL